MSRLRRIVFGEPQPGFAAFADILKPLDESVSYCNHPGTLQHDRVTDVPFALPEIGFFFTHPTALITDKIQMPGHGIGFFANHHMALYLGGAQKADIDTVHKRAAQLCSMIYASPADWTTKTDNVVWGLQKDPDRTFVVFRGSDSWIDWLRDLTAIDPSRIVQHDTFGPVWGGFLLGMQGAWQAIKPELAGSDEVVFTGHSLGASHADIAAAMCLIEQNKAGL